MSTFSSRRVCSINSSEARIRLVRQSMSIKSHADSSPADGERHLYLLTWRLFLVHHLCYCKLCCSCSSFIFLFQGPLGQLPSLNLPCGSVIERSVKNWSRTINYGSLLRGDLASCYIFKLVVWSNGARRVLNNGLDRIFAAFFLWMNEETTEASTVLLQ